MLAFGLAFAAPNIFVNKAYAENTPETFRNLTLFGDVFEQIKANYVTDVSDEELIEAAINGMLTSLDPHSSYLNPEGFADMQVQTSGEFGGLGIEVTLENGVIKVVSPIDDTPAYRAGLQTGDYITKLDGEPVMGLTLPEAVDIMRGPVGETIKITIFREGLDEPFDVTITRDIIQIKSVRYEIMDNDIGYIRVTSFNAQATSGTLEAIAAMKEEASENDRELVGYVLDLRNNPGGLLNEAVGLAGVFIDHGEVVSTGGRIQGSSRRFNAVAGDTIDGLPLVTLINGGSASASEIVAGALQDHNRAIIMGTQSFGKGSVQTILGLSNQGAMRLTTAHYYTPSGRSIQALGIVPDIIVNPARVEELDGSIGRREADLRGALHNPNEDDDMDNAENPAANENNADTDAETSDEDPEFTDYQLSRALDLVHGISLYNANISNQSAAANITEDAE